jgi:hypothetical protein
VSDVDRPGREVEVSPAEGGELVYSQARKDQRGDDGKTVVDQPTRIGVELGGRLEHSDDLSCRLEMRCRRSLDLDPAALPCRRVLVDPSIFDGEGEEPAKHLDGLVDRAGRERSKRPTQRVGARAAFGEAAAVLGLLELVEPVGVDGPGVDLRRGADVGVPNPNSRRSRA